MELPPWSAVNRGPALLAVVLQEYINNLLSDIISYLQYLVFFQIYLEYFYLQTSNVGAEEWRKLAAASDVHFDHLTVNCVSSVNCVNTKLFQVVCFYLSEYLPP